MCYCIAMANLKYDLTGQTFGRLTALHHLGSGNWLVRCECGTEKKVMGQNLRTGQLKSCGCSYRGGVGGFNAGQGATHTRWQGDDVTYATAHKRVASQRGAASLHACVICSEEASSWAYRGGSDKELTEWREGGVVKAGLRRYSPDPADYDPMCWSCHARKDVAEARSRL